jgi:hypothetical protein
MFYEKLIYHSFIEKCHDLYMDYMFLSKNDINIYFNYVNKCLKYIFILLFILYIKNKIIFN